MLSRYYRGGLEGRVTMELQKNTKWKLHRKHFHDILSEFCLNGVSMDRCQLLWLLRSGKAVGYKVEEKLKFKVFWGEKRSTEI